MNAIERSVLDRLAHVSDALTARYGWTDLAFRVSADATCRLVSVTCRSALVSALRAIVQRRREFVEGPWRVIVDAATLPPGRMVVSGHPLTRLWRECPTTASRPSLATEWRRDDGPLVLLAQHDGWSLIRAADGTIGWVDGDRAWSGAAWSRPRVRRLGDVLGEFLAVPYRLGGATSAGIDCSALVQRVAREVYGVWIPRHTSDQLARFPHVETEDLRDGDVVYSSTAGGGLHAGVFAANRITHASSRRNEVVAEPADEYLAAAGAMRVVRARSILEASRS